MNYTIIIICAFVIGLVCLGVGWLIGFGKASEQYQNIEQANEYIEETSQFLTIGKIQYFEAANQVQLLQGLEKEEYSTMKASLIESLSSYYHSAKESVDDGMASEEELEMIEELTKLAAQSEYFESIITEK